MKWNKLSEVKPDKHKMLMFIQFNEYLYRYGYYSHGCFYIERYDSNCEYDSEEVELWAYEEDFDYSCYRRYE
jgi:hypothetical protein